MNTQDDPTPPPLNLDLSWLLPPLVGVVCLSLLVGLFALMNQCQNDRVEAWAACQVWQDQYHTCTTKLPMADPCGPALLTTRPTGCGYVRPK